GAPPQQPPLVPTRGPAINFPTAPSAPPPRGVSPNQTIVEQIKRQAISAASGKQSGTPQQTISQQSKKSLLADVPAWVWIIGAVAIGYLLIPKRPAPSTTQTTNQTKQFAPPQSAPSNTARDTRAMGGPYVPVPPTTPNTSFPVSPPPSPPRSPT